MIILNPGASKPFWAGNPLVYPKAIAHVPQLTAGDWVQVRDASRVPIAYGFFNPHSLYRVRLIAWVQEMAQASSEQDVLRLRIAQAIQLRQDLGLPNAHTNAYRLINSEGDKLSGLTVDLLGEVMVAHITALWVYQRQALLSELLQAHFPTMKIIWRLNENALAQDGWQKQAEEITKIPGHTVMIREHDLEYVIDPSQGQKTGFYCDQRETRLLVRELARGKNVLDACCFNGGFALNAAKGGALSVHGVDSSGPAILQAQKNAELNDVSITFTEQDALQALQTCTPQDLIILDPPKLAPSHKHLANAKRKYLQFNKAALNALAPKGYLLTCSCSQAMSVADLTGVLLEAALACQKNIQILKIGSAGPDHPQALAFSYNHYLKWILVRI
ncbi:MAG TPA: class I SAM-dependent rRNA methyltransferase [Gammaproteobacteria bacterium]|nr:class I SAM-dependent rRNA methyltransferase [Gammaproteobacteria bacterium]